MSSTSTYTALWLQSFDRGLERRQLPTPKPTGGQALVQVLSVRIGNLHKNLVAGKSPFPFKPDCVPGGGCIGRIEAVGSDSVSLKPGQLVYVDPTVRARDDSQTVYLQNMIHGYDEKTNKLVDAWRDGTWAEKLVVPLENAFVLDEKVLMGSSNNYQPKDLINIQKLATPYQGWKLAKLQPGETAAVAFATGSFGGAAIDVALSMGAGRIVALGRNADKLAEWRKSCDPRYVDRVVCVALTGDIEKDAEQMKQAAPNGLQIFFDMSPPSATATAHLHIQAGLKALEAGGRMIWMGFIPTGISINYGELIFKDISIHTKYMYTAQEVHELIRLIETGMLSLKQFQDKLFTGFDNFQRVLDLAETGDTARGGIVWSPQ
ncbi:GroES-like protein [Acaromyces ingoldii]|uniref:GroES-like protein n=1 Tax=Acaromyces ingoldii TaxID=215250 RepID=A0A316YWJ9_9BASI|nr:GroES-like protein [Acaromyces ingoldii]PWN93561.1 GroES-like protein [Acaromyces ingoldii]